MPTQRKSGREARTKKPASSQQQAARRDDARYMRLALHEAARGLGRTSPNPAVGALIVSADGRRILAHGWHRAAGQPHAEIEALRALSDPRAAAGATLYVTLEPCSTHGRTPPCTAAILNADLARVVVGAVDPNPAHAGRGLTLLRTAGVQVRAGVLGAECARLNRAFNHWIVTGQPWVIAKAALSLDGRLNRAPGEDPWLTSPAARAHAHRTLRACVDAILVGAGTVRTDNPRLTVRELGQPAPGTPRQPWRVVLTRSGDLPADAHVFTDEWKARTLVFRARHSADQTLREVLADLGRRHVTSVLIEGGGEVLGQAFREGVVNEVAFYLAPRLAAGAQTVLGTHALPGEGAALIEPRYERIGSDLCCRGLVRHQKPPGASRKQNLDETSTGV